jgi:hypothetical protein
MAKKQTNKEQTNDNRRQSRKEVLRDRKQAEQLRVIRIAAIIVGALILLVLGIALISEFFITPKRSVATVNGEEIVLSDWQNRVKFERAQRIITLEEQLANFNNDVGLVQQFSSQAIIELINENAEGLGEAVLDRMVEEEIIRQGAEERGLVPSDAEVDKRIGANFNYFGGDSPTPFPVPTEPVAPTPALTPIPADGEGDVQQPEAPLAPVVEGPTSTPFPTATPVSQESFQQEYDDLLAQYSDLGVSEQTYRSVFGNALTTERLIDALAEEQDLPEEDMHASIFFLSYSDEEEANQALDEIEGSDFLTVWNTVRSRPPDPTQEEANAVTASEVLWRTRDTFAGGFNEEIAEATFTLPLDTPSELLVVTGAEGETEHIIILVSGREMRELAENELQNRKQQLLITYLNERSLEGVETNELWRSRVPTVPLLDPKFRQPPTPAPGDEIEDVGGVDAGGDPTP